MKNIAHGLCGGAVMYLPFALSCYTLYLPKSSSNLFTCYDLLYYLIGAVIVLFTILYKSNSIKHSLLRTVHLLFGLFIAIVINGELGTLRYIDRLLRINEGETNGRATGIVSIIWLIAMLSVCFSANIIILVKIAYTNRIHNSTDNN